MPELEQEYLQALSIVFFSCLFCCNERIIIIGQTDRDVSRERRGLTLATDTEHTLSDVQNSLILRPPSGGFGTFE